MRFAGYLFGLRRLEGVQMAPCHRTSCTVINKVSGKPVDNYWFGTFIHRFWGSYLRRFATYSTLGNMTAYFQSLDTQARLIHISRLSAEDFAQLETSGHVEFVEGVLAPRSWAERLPRWRVAKERAYIIGRIRPRAVLTGLSAAMLHNLAVLKAPDRIELALPGKGWYPPRKTWSQHVVYRANALPELEITASRNVRITTIPRTIFDIARYHGIPDVVVTLDDAFRYRRVSGPDMDRYAQWMVGRKGSVAFREVLALADMRSESPGESVLRVQLRRAKDPSIRTIEPQAQIDRYRVDLLVNGKLVVEFDGKLKYGADGQSM